MLKSLQELLLPKTTSEEQLEALSLKKFAALFDEERFILKGETIDNGIDFRNEIVSGSQKLGFGFNFQLKAKQKFEQNADGSVSKTLYTSNIEYLINNSQPAFYGFYVKSIDNFYYVYLNDLIVELHRKDPDWENQATHTVRFSTILDKEAVNRIYQIAFDEGNLARQLKAKSIELGSLLADSREMVTIDPRQNKVYDDKSIREYVEASGLGMINKAEWSEILLHHNNSTSATNLGAKYCVIVGAAFYYSGCFFDSLSMLKKGKRIPDELPDYLKKYRDYHFAVAKFRLGYITSEEFEREIASIQTDDSIKFYVDLARITSELKNAPNLPKDNFKEFERDLFVVINSDSSSVYIKQLYSATYLLHLGYRFNLEFVQAIARVKDSKNRIFASPVDIYKRELEQTMGRNNFWFDQVDNLLNQTRQNKNWFIFNLLLLYHGRIFYQWHVYVKSFNLNVNERNEEVIDRDDRMSKILTIVDSGIDYFRRIGHIDNLLSGLKLKYEISKFNNDEVDLKDITTEMEKISLQTGAQQDVKDFHDLTHGGTMHEQFDKFFQSKKDDIKKIDAQFLELKKKMTKMDRKDKLKSINVESRQIELFPIGCFLIPKNEVEKTLKKMNVESPVISHVEQLMAMRLRPVLNIYNNPIKEYGYERGFAAENPSIECWKNIYKIRKYFFKKGFLRMKC